MKAEFYLTKQQMEIIKPMVNEMINRSKFEKSAIMAQIISCANGTTMFAECRLLNEEQGLRVIHALKK